MLVDSGEVQSHARPSWDLGDRPPRIAIAHDYLTQQGGAERVALHLADAFPGAPIFTSVFDPEGTFPEFRNHDVRTSGLQRISAFRRDPRRAFPLLARSWADHDLTEFDAVVVSTSGWAHGIAAKSNIPRIVYCHNTPRWLYQTGEYVQNIGERTAVRALRRRLTTWDQAAACRATEYFANSRAVQGRVRACYGIDASFLPPPPGLAPEGPSMRPPESPDPGFMLCIARNRRYKNVKSVIAVAESEPGRELAIVGLSRTDLRDVPDNVSPLGRVSDTELRWLYTHASSLVNMSHEDFGLTPIEANGFGTPAVAIRAAGFLDSVDDGVSGILTPDDSTTSILKALEASTDLKVSEIKRHARRFSPSAFKHRIQTATTSTVRDARSEPRTSLAS